jgi:nicotinamide-nucleotide amidase
MISEILVIGDEIRSGVMVNSNAAYIARKLKEIGVEVTRHSAIGNDPTDIINILKEISQRSNIAVVIDGQSLIGENLKAAAAAKVKDVSMSVDTQALVSMENHFKAHSRPLTHFNKKKAMLLPSGTRCLRNLVGESSDFHFKIEQCDFFFLPGVPSEMRQMLQEQVIPWIRKIQKTTTDVRLIKTFSTFGLTESAMVDHVDDFNQLFPQIELSFRTNFPGIQVNLYTRGTDEGDVRVQMEAANQWVYRKLGNKIISDIGESIEKVVGDLLGRKQAHLAVAESCTGGLIADLLTNVPGSSDYFVFSAVTYSNQLKMKILGVTAQTLDRYGAVSEQTAKEMAHGVQQISDTTYGLSVSGIAGPGGATIGKPVGTVCIGLASSDFVRGHRFCYKFNDRWMNKYIFATTALDLLRQELLGIPHG